MAEGTRTGISGLLTYYTAVLQASLWPKPGFWLRPETDTETKNERDFGLNTKI